MDALSEILGSATLSGGVFLDAALSDPWCLRSEISAQDCSALLGPVDQIVLYHFVSEGQLTVQADGYPEQHFVAGEAAILPTNHPHLLGGNLSHPPTPALAVAERGEGGLSLIRTGGGGPRTRLICGFLGGAGGPHSLLMEHLPPLMRFDTRRRSVGAWIRRSLRFAADEVASGRPGSDALLGRLSEILFLEAVRDHLDHQRLHSPDGWLSALTDPLLSRSLALLHRQLDRRWTLNELGRTVGASRTALSDRFKAVLGIPPMRYLTRIRMIKAAGLVQQRTLTLAEIAQRVGYESEAALSRAFRRFHGVSPRAFSERQGAASAG